MKNELIALLPTATDGEVRTYLESKDGMEFIEEYTKYFRDDVAIRSEPLLDLKPDILKELLAASLKKDKKKFIEFASVLGQDLISSLGVNLSELAALTRGVVELCQRLVQSANIDVENMEQCAYFIFLNKDLLLPNIATTSKDLLDWVQTAYEKYRDSTVIKFVYAYLINLNLYMVPPDSNLISDAYRYYIESLIEDSESIIQMLTQDVRIIEEYFTRHPKLLRSQYEHIGKALFPKVSPESFLNVTISNRYSSIADAYLLIGQEENSKEVLKKALSIYNENSFALVEQAVMKIDEDSVEAESIINKALRLTKDQWVGTPYQVIVQTLAYMGLGRIYHERMVYPLAEKNYTEALNLHPPRYYDAIIRINRGQNRLDDDDIVGALSDLSKAQNERHTAPLAHTNLGTLYFKQGLFDKSESELLKAIDMNPILAPAYYNLGVLYNEEGKTDDTKKEGAKRLFRTTLNLDRNYQDARNALTELQGAQIKGLSDWVSWWFGPKAPTLKKVIGFSLIAVVIAFMGIIIDDIFTKAKSVVPQDVYIALGITIAILLLPSISSLKVGPVELDMQSQDKKLSTADT